MWGWWKQDKDLTPAQRNKRREKKWLKGQRRGRFAIMVVIGVCVLGGWSGCHITRYDVFGQPIDTVNVTDGHVDSWPGTISAWDRVQALADANYNPGYDIYWEYHTHYTRDFVNGGWRETGRHWTSAECGVMTKTWRGTRDACTSSLAGVRG